MELLRGPGGLFLPRDAYARFREKCRFEPETGCVIWVGGTTQGRGHHVPYGAFWFERRRWFAHRWAAKYIHGLDIEGMQVDHCCPNIPKPNTLCVQHLQAVTAKTNRELQTRRTFIYLQVGIIQYHELYGEDLDPEESVPFYNPPSWLGDYGETNGNACPF